LLLSDDPGELRMGAGIWFEASAEENRKAAQLDLQIEKLQQKKLLLEKGMRVSELMQRRDEESGAISTTTIPIPWGSDVTTERAIEGIDEKVFELMKKSQEYKIDAERFKNHSGRLEQRAAQIDARFRGESGND